MSPIYVCFYTVGNGYDAEAAELGQTLDHWGLPHDLVPVAPFSNWVEACGYKPLFLQAMRRKHGRRPLVWLDADARVRKFPQLFIELGEETYDHRANFYDFAAHWRDGHELLSGTLYFGATPAADRLLEEWAAACMERPGDFDQLVLQRIVDWQRHATNQSQLNVFELPAPYTLIFDLMAGDGPAVIEHMQASRRLRR